LAFKAQSEFTVLGQQKFQTNSSGIRGDREYLITANPAITRVAMIGDFFTLGEEVGETETFSYQLQKS
jgi:hypothetical protein